MLPFFQQTGYSAVIEPFGELSILRDDLIPGGTKRRALVRYLPELKSKHFIYAGSVYGSGGWALAEACRELGLECTLALSKSDYRAPWLNLIDCEVKWFDPQPVYSIQEKFSGEKGLLPLGFDDPVFRRHMVKAFSETKIFSSEIWMSAVSGTLVRCAQLAWPDKTINVVCVAKNHGNLGVAKKFKAQEKYHQAARMLPPYPSNLFSDAKIWSFAKQFALKGSLIWNTSA